MTFLLTKFQNFLFKQPIPIKNARFLEKSVAVAVALIACTEVDHNFWWILGQHLQMENNFLFIIMQPWIQFVIKCLISFFALGVLFEISYKLSLTLLLVAYTFWAGSLYHIHDFLFNATWNPHGFLVTLLFISNIAHLLEFLNKRFIRLQLSDGEIASWSVATAKIYIITLYFQAAMAKILSPDRKINLNGQQLVYYINLIGSDLAKDLMSVPYLPFFLANSVLVFELIVWLIFLFYSEKIAGILGVLFHLSCGIFLGIYFWFLLLLYPAIFWFVPLQKLSSRVWTHPASMLFLKTVFTKKRE